MTTALPAEQLSAPHATQPQRAGWLRRSRLLWAAAGWTLALAAATALVVDRDLAAQRDTQRAHAGLRMASLNLGVQTLLKQAATVPRALAILPSTAQALLDTPATDDLRSQPAVGQTSRMLHALARQADLDAVWLVDRQGRIVADSRIDGTRSTLGHRMNRYGFFQEAVQSGQAMQIDKLGPAGLPALVFAARVGTADDWQGLVVGLMPPSALGHLLQDAQRRLLITDAQGQILALGGGRPEDGPAATALGWQGRVPMAASDAVHPTSPGQTWRIERQTLSGQTVWDIRADDQQRWLAVQRPLSAASLQAWCLIPLNGAQGLMLSRLLPSALLWALGLGLLALLDQRNVRVRSLTRVQRNLNDMAHALPLSVFRYERPPQGTGRFTFLGDDAAALLGLPPDALAHQPERAWRLSASADDPSHGPSLPPTRLVEFPVTHGQRTAWVACNSRRHTRADGTEVFNGFWTDVTVQKETEAAMRQAHAASQAATEAKSRFLANMSHEIRTPMNAILGMTHLALLEPLNDKARNYVDKAHRAASGLLQILNDVLDFSKIESGKLELEHTAFQLDQVISQMADVLGVRAEEKGLELLFTSPPELPTALVGDPVRLGQILVNLGTNAIKFTREGDVLIGCEVEGQRDGQITLHFWVRDTGIGMDAEQIDRLFQPFTQADSSTTRQYGGTGLGLSICRELVALMSGRIWVESAPGHGSTFHFTVRLGMQVEDAPPRRALLAEELRGKRLLLLDDNATALDVLGHMAGHLGLQVDTCASGEEALRCMQHALARGEPHHVLLTDWKMPGMDGIAFARQALAMPPEHRPCVLLVTAFAREEALRAAQGVGLAGVLNKPVTPSTLFNGLSAALGRDLPAAEVATNAGRLLQLAQQRLAGARVLLVEDQAMNQELARDLLERAGLRVVLASHGGEAIDALRTQGPFDAVLMDCQMPVMDGYTATEAIRAQAQWQQLPIIAMTASAMANDRERVLACGMNDHITKPLELAQMFNILARWIRPVDAPPPGTA
ncbi:MAG: hypothetical protein RI907_3463, partial [Pseudomonadota bacterium]